MTLDSQHLAARGLFALFKMTFYSANYSARCLWVHIKKFYSARRLWAHIMKFYSIKCLWPHMMNFYSARCLCGLSHDEKALAALSDRGEQDALQLLVVLGIRQDEEVEAGVGGGQAAPGRCTPADLQEGRQFGPTARRQQRGACSSRGGMIRNRNNLGFFIFKQKKSFKTVLWIQIHCIWIWIQNFGPICIRIQGYVINLL